MAKKEKAEDVKEELKKAPGSISDEKVSVSTSTEKSENKKEEDVPKEDDIEEMTSLRERSIAMLAYAGPLAIVPFYLKKDSKFCRFHGKQGLILFLLFFMLQFFAVIDLVFDILLFLQVIIFLWYGVSAMSGKWKKVPLVYGWASAIEESLMLKSKEEEEEEAKLKPNEVSEKEEGPKQ